MAHGSQDGFSPDIHPCNLYGKTFREPVLSSVAESADGMDFPWFCRHLFGQYWGSREVSMSSKRYREEFRAEAIRAAKLRDWPVGERLVTSSPVCSYNEWDPLEEVVVGRLEGAMIPSKHLTVSFNIPQRLTRIYKLIAGLPYPKFV